MRKIHKNAVALILSFFIFIPSGYSKSVIADLAPICASTIFFSVATIIAVKSAKKKKEPPVQQTKNTAPSESNQASLYDPNPILKNELSNP